VEDGVEVTVGSRPAPAAVGSTAADPLPLRLELRQGGRAVATLDTALPDLGSGSGTGEAGVRRTPARLTPAPGARVGTGLAMVRARVGDGAPVDRAVFLVDPAELDRLEVELERKETTAGSPAVRDAVATVAIRLAWLRDFLGAAPANAPLDGPVEWWTDAARWTASVRLGEAPVPTTPGVHRLAHRSRLDGTLQPYSIHLPDDYDPGHPGGYPLLVALHGSGVDERGTVASAGKATAARGWIVVAPRGRGLSDYYVGAAETDVLEALEHAIRILPVDTARVALGGFSMGGYGAWRMALRHGHRFDAVAVMAGAPCPPEATGGKCVDSLLDDAAADGRRVPPLLVVHGALDHAIPVDRARPLVRRARELTALEYREIPDVGHGHPSWWGEALEWLGPE
ncbi:MAG: alpha/beta hydrolase-fold protein, partial [Gemmatimonadota bacterium]